MSAMCVGCSFRKNAAFCIKKATLGQRCKGGEARRSADPWRNRGEPEQRFNNRSITWRV